MSILSLSVSRGGVQVPLQNYNGVVTLIVNTASRCSFTAANIDVLNSLQRAYSAKGFTVLAFPCGQFANQEPLSNSEMGAWSDEFGIAFPIFDRIDVKGKKADPLFITLGDQLGKPRWNYTKYLCDRNGVPVRRLDPSCPYADAARAVEALL